MDKENSIVMKEIPLAMPFKRHHPLLDSAKEFNINFIKTSTFSELIDFMTTFSKQRVNIKFTEQLDMDVVYLISNAEWKNRVAIRLTERDFFSIQKLKELGIQFFFDYSFGNITNFTQLESFLEYGVSDVYIWDDLCYNLPDVSAKVRAYGAQLRLVANRIPCSIMNDDIFYKQPIHRPQDYNFLKQYIDVFEFDCEGYNNEPGVSWGAFDVLCDAWFRKHDWYGDLKEINRDINFTFPCRQIMPGYIEYKSMCGRHCAQRVTNGCRKCKQYYQLALDLLDSGVQIKGNS